MYDLLKEASNNLEVDIQEEYLNEEEYVDVDDDDEEVICEEELDPDTLYNVVIIVDGEIWESDNTVLGRYADQTTLLTVCSDFPYEFGEDLISDFCYHVEGNEIVIEC